MRWFSHFGVLFCFVFLGCAPSALSWGPRSTSTGMEELPGAGFNVHILLSPKAKARLNESQELIVVRGYLTGTPKAHAPERFINEMGEIDLGEVGAEIKPDKDASFKKLKVERQALAQTDMKDPKLLINVFSARRSVKDNLLDCGIYQGSLKPVQGTTVQITCQLIGESGGSVK